MTCVDPVINEAYLVEKGAAHGMYRQCLEQAVAFLARAKKMHDEMEGYYVPYMDFAAVNARRERVLEKILEFAAELRDYTAISIQ